MEIIREGPSASCPPVLDGKNYSYWKPRMIFFIKTLDGKAWRALVASYDPPMITVNGVSVPKPEVDWTDTEEKASVRNARTLNAIFNGVDLNVFKLINSCSTAKEVSNYNKRVLEITNESLLLDEKIPDSKIVRKVLRSLRRKFDMKVTAIEEAHDITTLKLDELFDEDTDDNEEDNGMNAFTVHVTKTDSDDESEISEENYDNELTFEEFKVLWKEDTEARAIQKERIQDLMEENERLMSIISSLKLNLKEVQKDYDQTIKSVKMLRSGTENLNLILNSGQDSSSKYGLSFDASERSIKPTTETKFIPALVKDETKIVPTTTVVNPPAKTTRWTCYYCVQLINLKSRHSLMEEKNFVQKVVLDEPPKGDAKVVVFVELI
ncbi:gag-pol polyprotein [Cucumis melo var. makuwa]|uniref:Gag-pol polyprotein n=1 Tax=Cucumis melo var. makuwa TaxID=1194695 RepID=A0A5A7TJQ7_CUCMM|nr:gag-pol polyprotein [Cucumis melo var. makuwa]